MKRKVLFSSFVPLIAVAGLIWYGAQKNTPVTVVAPDADNAGLKLPEGFGALRAAENTGRARHIAVTQTGDIYVRLARLKEGKGALFLHDTNGDGKMDETKAFANYSGTGVYVKDGYLYAASNSEVFRYKLNDKQQVIDENAPEKIITGLIAGNQHETKSVVLDNEGNIYVGIGAPSNSCQIEDRKVGSMGREGCPILDSAGGVWQFKANKLNQTYKDGVRYATGLRNVVGLDWNQQNNQLFAMQHGRDQLFFMFPNLYTAKQSAIYPAECMYALKKGDNAGWPYIYYDQDQKKKILAPEYGGDSKKEGMPNAINPAVAYPGHMAPNAILFYTGNQFPAKYKNGAFIAFHGSWNRSPEPQAGFFVVFQPFKDGKPFGDYEVFADGFTGSPEKTASGRADHKPCGLAQGPDGSLYVSDDVKGTIYRIVYNKK
jgi:glucose/arabinose dehydrogenase